MGELAKEPAWLVAMIDQRLALMEDHIGNTADVPANVVMTPLSEPEHEMGSEEFERWDRTCDHCGRYCPEPEQFYTGHSVRVRGQVQVIFNFGVCPTCREIRE